jgi:general stress protein 26
MEKNLKQQEAVKKFKKLAEDVRVCMFITNTNAEDEHTRPMSTIEVEEDGTLWFFTDIRSIKIEEVAADKEVHLTYAHPGKESYMDVWGSAKVVTDKQQIKDKWSPIIKAWFPDGVDDPNIALLKIKPNQCYYWDAETGKMVQFLKMAAAAITGKRLADGKEGKLIL